MRIFIFTTLLFVTTNLFSQISFKRTNILPSSESCSFFVKDEEYNVSINREAASVFITTKKKFKYKSPFQDAELDFCVFTCPKSDIAYILINNYVDFSLGCELFSLENEVIKHIGKIDIAAYNSIDEEPMNYNSILPHIYSVSTANKVYFSFETPLVVYKPGSPEEEIIDGSKIHYTLTKGKLEVSKAEED